MKAAGSRRDRIRAQLADLKMPGALEAVDDVLTRVDGGGVTASEAIEQLLGAQIMLRNNRRLQAATPVSSDAASRSSPIPRSWSSTRSATCRSARPAPCSSSNSSTGATSAHPPCSRPTKGSKSGVRSWATKSWPLHSSIACYTTVISSTYVAAATACASTSTFPRSYTRLLRSRALYPPREREQEQRRSRRTRGSSPPPGVTFSPATFVTFSTGVDTMAGWDRFRRNPQILAEALSLISSACVKRRSASEVDRTEAATYALAPSSFSAYLRLSVFIRYHSALSDGSSDHVEAPFTHV